ncbi:MAG: hypothetical protein H7145_02285, partial [Akkermansiaceae bacterium]|nr:hypothetical protein [Armatimonadota bacterium]
MLDRFRLPLLIVSLLIVLYGGWAFWSGREAVEQQRRTARPREATLDDLVLNPPRKNGEWYTITDGAASIPRSVLEDYKGGSDPVANAPFFLYAPILRGKDAARIETVEQLREDRPAVSVLLRTQDKGHARTYRTMMGLQSSDSRTTDAWLAQNHKQLVIRAPFTGLLLRRQTGSLQNANLARVNADYLAQGWILAEGKKPAVDENPQVVLGLTLIMGVPTVWLFGLLFAGKLDPPDDEMSATNRAPGAVKTARTVQDA